MDFVFWTYLSTVSNSLKHFVGIIDGWLFAFTLITSAILVISIFVYWANDSDGDGITKEKRNEPFKPEQLNTAGLSFFGKVDRISFGVSVVKWLMVSGFIATIAYSLIPKKQDAYLVLSGYVVQKAAQSESVQQIGEKSLTAIEKWLDKQVRDANAELAAEKEKAQNQKGGK